MRVGIDAHSIGNHKTGNETYSYNLVKELSLLPSNGDEYIIYLTKGGVWNGLGLNGRLTHRRIRPATPYLRIPVAFPLESRMRRLDVFHATYILPSWLKCRTVLTVHDICYERFPEFYTRADYWRNKLAIPWSCRRAGRIITISEATKRDLVELYRLDPERITVIYLAASEDYKPLDPASCRERLRAAYQITEPFILCVGSLQPRKNLSRLLRAFAQLKVKDRIPHKLVIAGQKAWLCDGIFETLRKQALETEVILTGYVPAEDLPIFYNAASFLAYPSIYEGFGLPVIEAMACGTPVMTSCGSSLEEVAGGAAILVDPYSVSSMADAMEIIANNPELQKNLGRRSLANASRFSFRKMAEQTRYVYQHV